MHERGSAGNAAGGTRGGRSSGSGGRGEWPGPQPLDAAHDSRVGRVADRVHRKWSVASVAELWPGTARCVAACSVPTRPIGASATLHRCLRDAARHPNTVVTLFLDEFGYQRWPEVAPTWGLEAEVAQRAGNNQQWRTIGTLNALTGQVNYLDGYIVGRQQVIQFYAQLDHAYPEVDLLYVIQDNWNIHTHPDVLTALESYPGLPRSGCPPMLRGSIPLRSCGAGCGKTSSRCIAG